jgi:general secretion pathway protein A
MNPETAMPQLGRLCDRDFFYISATHAEALARLEYFVRQQWNFAMLLGTGGSGRSSTLRAFSRRLTWQNYAVAIVDASMVSPIQFLAGLAESWKIDCHPTSDLMAHWAAIEQRLHEYWYSRTCPIVMVDNIDFCPIDVQETVMRLASLPAALAARIQFVLTAHDGHLEQIDERIRERIDLRIDLERWSDDEIREFLLAALPNTKNVDKFFTPDAIAGLQRASGGISRKVRQLVRLVLLAAESQGTQHVDGATVAAVRAELTV